MSLTLVLRRDVAPVGSAYLMFLIIFVRFLRRRSDDAEGEGARSAGVVARRLRWPALLRFLVGTLAGGYLFFVLVILVFYLVLGGQPRNFISQSLAQGSVLAFGVVLPAFAILTLTEPAIRRRLTSGQRARRRRPPQPG